VPCDEIPNWQDVAGEEVPQSVLDRLNTEPALQDQGLFDEAAVVQRPKDAAGTTGNLSNCRWVDCECIELNTDSFGDEAYGGGGGA